MKVGILRVERQLPARGLLNGFSKALCTAGEFEELDGSSEIIFESRAT
jgi:hypothetical protein